MIRILLIMSYHDWKLVLWTVFIKHASLHVREMISRLIRGIFWNLHKGIWPFIWVFSSDICHILCSMILDCLPYSTTVAPISRNDNLVSGLGDRLEASVRGLRWLLLPHCTPAVAIITISSKVEKAHNFNEAGCSLIERTFELLRARGPAYICWLRLKNGHNYINV